MIKASEDTSYMIALVDDKNGDPLGYVTGYRRGGYYHPGDIIQCVYDEDQCDLISKAVTRWLSSTIRKWTALAVFLTRV